MVWQMYCGSLNVVLTALQECGLDGRSHRILRGTLSHLIVTFLSFFQGVENFTPQSAGVVPEHLHVVTILTVLFIRGG